MTITVDVKPEVHDALARQAAAHGHTDEAYIVTVLEEVVRLGQLGFDKERAQAAGLRIRELRKGITLGALTISERIYEGRL
ncbi:MAG: hypothetical protein ABSH31_13785 [Bryobacteraceae bacterium]|jgi:hypothetical protein